jgi:prepilin-type N-terminal cleavage/methylation domain-containing protein
MKDEKGFSLIEVVIAIGVLGIIAVGFFTALSGSTKALITADERTTAESLARSQMEYIKKQNFVKYNTVGPNIPYERITDPYFTISYQTANVTDTGLQKITITVTRNSTTRHVTFEDYKLER